MKFYKDDLVMVIHPDYPELQGLAKVTKASDVIALVWVYLYVDNSEHFVHIEFLRHATDEEIRAASKSYIFISYEKTDLYNKEI